MQIMNRKNLTKVQTSLLIKLKNTILKRADIVKKLGKEHTKMLVDVLSEIDSRKNQRKKIKYLN